MFFSKIWFLVEIKPSQVITILFFFLMYTRLINLLCMLSCFSLTFSKPWTHMDFSFSKAHLMLFVMLQQLSHLKHPNKFIPGLNTRTTGLKAYLLRNSLASEFLPLGFFSLPHWRLSVLKYIFPSELKISVIKPQHKYRGKWNPFGKGSKTVGLPYFSQGLVKFKKCT